MTTSTVSRAGWVRPRLLARLSDWTSAARVERRANRAFLAQHRAILSVDRAQGDELLALSRRG